mmetsp:Transcript_31638/g.57476  ORF Transcript_31638/g.57476 Transcript_31638/m.57476 type:complete len:219 (-) Transcript_31638:1411-2067(-)
MGSVAAEARAASRSAPQEPRRPPHALPEAAGYQGAPRGEAPIRLCPLRLGSAGQGIHGTPSLDSGRRVPRHHQLHAHHLHPLHRRRPHRHAPALRREERVLHGGASAHDFLGPGPRAHCRNVDHRRRQSRRLGVSAKLPFGQLMDASLGRKSRGIEQGSRVVSAPRFPPLAHLHALQGVPRSGAAERSQAHERAAQGRQSQHEPHVQRLGTRGPQPLS